MKINTYLIQLAITLILAFGVSFTIRYFRTGDIWLDQLIPAVVGVILLFGALIWRKLNK